jgi:cytochrome c biogenesis protein CcmG/thiol:disulfide interchange protein DsbE
MRLLFYFLLLFQFLHGGAQEQLPSVTIKSINGKETTTQSLLDGNTPVVISFWATWCKPCLQELDAFNDLSEIWKKEVKARIIAVSIDDSRTAAGIKKTLGLHDWSFDVYWDENQEFKRALNINLIPHTIVVDKKGAIVKRYTAYIPGNELKVLELLKTL